MMLEKVTEGNIKGHEVPHIIQLLTTWACHCRSIERGGTGLKLSLISDYEIVRAVNEYFNKAEKDDYAKCYDEHGNLTPNGKHEHKFWRNAQLYSG